MARKQEGKDYCLGQSLEDGFVNMFKDGQELLEIRDSITDS